MPCHAVPCWNQVVSTADFVASDDLSHMKNGQLIDLMKQVRDGDLSVDDAVRAALSSNEKIKIKTTQKERKQRESKKKNRKSPRGSVRTSSTSSMKVKHERGLDELMEGNSLLNELRSKQYDEVTKEEEGDSGGDGGAGKDAEFQSIGASKAPKVPAPFKGVGNEGKTSYGHDSADDSENSDGVYEEYDPAWNPYKGGGANGESEQGSTAQPKATSPDGDGGLYHNLSHINPEAQQELVRQNTPESPVRRSVILIALYPFKAGAEDEITSFQKGERLVLLHKLNTDWYMVRKAGTAEAGLAPSSYLKEITSNRKSEVTSAMSVALSGAPPRPGKPDDPDAAGMSDLPR